MVIVDIVALHAEEAGFLWTSRDRAVSAPHYSLKTLATLDERVEAHLDGLRIAGDTGWLASRKTLENAGPGEIFTLAVLAFGSGDRQRMRDVLAAGCVSPETERGLVSALGWLDHQAVTPWVKRLLRARAAPHRRVGVAACAIRRQDPGEALTAALNDPDPALRARGLRAVGELKRVDLLDGVRAHLSDEEESCRFWAAWTLTLCRHRGGLSSIAQWFSQQSQFTRPALEVSMRTVGLEEGRHWIRTLAKDPGLRRSAVVAAGALGDPACMPWLIGLMESPELSRLAGEAFSTLTGVDLVDKNFDQNGPSGSEAADEESGIVSNPDEDEHLPWPRPGLIAEWWNAHQDDFRHASRYLAGQPVHERAARELLAAGSQRQRAAAAIELAVADPEEPLFEVRAMGSRQRALLGIQG